MPDGMIDGGDPLRPASPRLRSPLLRLATWNVNSIRTRLDRVLDWLERAEVDVLAMQETKCSDEQFPTMPFFELGYEVAHCGFNQWNGVAIASRVGLDNVEVGFDGQPTWSSKPDVAAAAEARALAATCAGVRVWSLYVPNGRALDDPHYTYKLNWLAALRDTAEGWLRDDPIGADRAGRRLEHRSDRRRRLERRILRGRHPCLGTGAQSVRRDRRRSILGCGKAFHARPGRLHLLGLHPAAVPEATGMRIDFILASPALAGRVADAQIVREERKGKAPSDHAPVLVDLRPRLTRCRSTRVRALFNVAVHLSTQGHRIARCCANRDGS